MPIYTYLFNSISCLCQIFNCCKYGKKKNISIKNKAIQMLNDWKVDTYANNRFLHKIPEERSRKQYKLFLKELEDNNL